MIAHDNVLRLFVKSNLQMELDAFSRLADHLVAVQVEHGGHAMDSSALSEFLEEFHRDDPLNPSFARLAAKMWPEHYRRSLEVDLNAFNISVERRQIMLASVIAWQWLNNDCVDVIETTLSHIDNPSRTPCASTWLSDLTRHVHHSVVNRVTVRFEAADYLPGISTQGKVAIVSPRSTNASSIRTVVCDQVLRTVRQWLNFPSNTEYIAAYFILHVLRVCHHNPDILLLHGLWKPYRSVKASVLLCPSWKKHTSLRISMLDDFVSALHALPIADPTSVEAGLLTQITAVVHRCDPRISSATAQIVELILCPNPIPRQVVEGSALCTTLSTPSASPCIGLDERGLHALRNFILELVPLVEAQSPGPHWTPLQNLVMSDKDRFLPFREHGPSRRRVTSTEGPFHPQNIRRRGAFASTLVFRGLLFASSAIRFQTLGFFEDVNEWQLFLDLEGYDPGDKESSAKFFVERAYGTPQHGRTVHSRTYANVYFEKEPEWEELLGSYPDEQLPFMVFLDWTQQKTGWFDDEGEYHRGGRFPLIGPLAGYLLAADMSYTGLVMAPNVQEVGVVIKKNGFGSLAGLTSLNLISGKTASAAAVVVATERVYNVLQDAMSAQVQDAVGFDAIMVEHALCKYGRCMKALRS